MWSRSVKYDTCEYRTVFVSVTAAVTCCDVPMTSLARMVLFHDMETAHFVHSAHLNTPAYTSQFVHN